MHISHYSQMSQSSYREEGVFDGVEHIIFRTHADNGGPRTHSSVREDAFVHYWMPTDDDR